jgi:hypothetical protein
MMQSLIKLEMEMNRTKAEHGILVKRREIERQQAELRQLEDMYGASTRLLQRGIRTVQVLVIPSHKIHCIKVQVSYNIY